MDLGNDDLNVGVSFDTDIRPIVSALAEIKAAIKSMESALPRGQMEKALADPIVSAVRTIENQVGGMREKIRQAQGAMVDDARKAGKGMASAMAGGMEEGARTVKRQLAQMQTEYEQAVAKGWRVNLATLQKMREEGVRLFAQDRRRLIDANAEKRLETEATRAGTLARKAMDKAFIDSASAIDPRTLLGLQPDRLVSSAKAAAAVFSEAFRLDEKGGRPGGVDARALLGLSDVLVSKAAKDSAAVFEREFKLDERGTRAGPVNARALLGLSDATLGKAAKDSAAVFQREFKLDEGSRAGGIDARTLLGLSEASVAKAAKDSAAVFAREFRLDDMGARGGRVDARTLLGLDSNAVGKAARESAAVFAREFRLDEKGLRGGATIDPRTLLGMPSASEMSSFTESLKSQMMAQAALTEGKKSLTKESSEAERAQRELDKALRKNTGAMNDAHSAARGLASGFNAMWLTWGNIAPLLAGAAVSNAFVQSLKMGAEVAQNFAKIYALGGESRESINLLNDKLLEMGSKGPYGPIEVSKALKTLSLAGLDARQQIEAIQTVLNFAVAGDLPIEKAAETLVAVGTAYGYSAKNYSVVSDVIAQAAASSMASVESMSEAFRQASVVAQQYGVSLKDTALNLTMLAQVGIQGSAAGTAMRNMYTELLGSSQKARKVLQDVLKFDAWDKEAKAMKPVVQIYKEMEAALSKFGSRDQQKILNALGNERGTKQLAAGFAALRTEVEKTGGTVSNALEEMEKRLAEAPGFAALAAAQMAKTTQNQIKGVYSALQTELVKAFQEVEPEVQKLAMSLKSAIQSEDFQRGIQGMVSGIASLLSTLVSLGDYLKAAAQAFIVFKAAQYAAMAGVAIATTIGTAATAFSALRGAVAGGTTALVALQSVLTILPGVTLASAAAFTTLQASLGVIGLLIAGVGAAYYFLSDGASEAKKKKEALNISVEAGLEGLFEEEKRLNKLIEMRRQGVKEAELEQRSKAEMLKAEVLQRRDVELATLRQARATMLATKASIEERIQAADGRVTPAQEMALKRNEGLLKVNTDGIVDSILKAQDAEERIDRAIRTAQQNAVEANREAAGSVRKPSGPQTFDEDALSKRRPRAATLKTDLGTELAMIKQRYADEVSTIQQFERNEQELLKLRHQSELITDGEFYARELALAQKSEADRLQLIETSRAEYIKKQAEQASALQDEYARVLKDNDGKLKGDEAIQAREAAATSLQQALVKLGGEGRTFYLALANDEKTIKDNALTRIEKQAIAAARAVKAVLEASKEFWREQMEANKALDRREALEDQTRYATEGEAAYLNAAAEVRERYTAELVKQDRAIVDLQQSLNSYIDAVGADTVMNDEQARALAQYVELLLAAKAARDKLAGSLDDAADDAGIRALRKQQKEEVKRLTADTADAIVTGLTRGGKEGSRAVRQIIERELRKPLVMMVQAVIQPIMGQLLGSLGIGGAAAGAAGSAGGGMLGNLAGSAAGSMLGGLGMAGTTGLANVVGMLGGDALGVMAAGAGGGFSSALGAAIAQVPVWGWIAAGLLAIAASLDDSGTYHTGGAAQYSAANGLSSGQSGADYRIGFGRVEEGKEAISAVGNIAKGLTTALDGIAVAFGKTAGYEIATAFADDTSKDGAWGALRISKDGKDLLNWEDTRQSRWAPREFADGEEGYKQYLAAVAKDTRQVLLDMDLPSWADEMLTALGEEASMDQLTQVLQQIGQIQTAFVALGKAIEGFAGMTDEAFSAIVKASGGVAALTANAKTYYDNFYTPEERKAKSQKDLDDKFAELGIAKPKDRAGFRALVDQSLAEADAQAKSRKALVGSASTAISALGKTGITAADLGKLGFNGIDPALLGGKGDPAQQAKLKQFLDNVNVLSGKGLDPDAFKKGLAGLVDANSEILGLGKDAGATAAALLGLSGAFAELNDSAEDTAARIRKEQADARDKAYRALERAIQKEKEALQVRMDAANEIISTMQGLFDLLQSNVKELYEEVESTRDRQAAEGRAFIARALETARLSGYLPEEKELSEAISSARGGLNADNYATQFELDRDRLVLAGQLSQLEEISGKQLTDAQRTLRELEDQSKQLDETLEYWREQIEIANGTYEAVISVEDAIRDLIDLTKPPETNLKAPERVSGAFVIGGGTGGAGGSGPAKPGSGFFGALGTEINDPATVARLTSIRDYTRTLDFSDANKPAAVAELGRQAAIYGVHYREIAIANGYPPEDVARMFEEAGVPVPRYEIGTNYVPRTGFALLHEGEAVVPKAYNPAAGGAGGGRMEALLESLVEQNTRLEIRLAAIEGHTQDTSRATNGNPVSPVPTALMENLTV